MARRWLFNPLFSISHFYSTITVSVSIRKTAFFSLLFFIAAGASAQRYTKDTRTYFDFGSQFYVSTLERASGDTLDVRGTSASPMLSFVRDSRQQGERFYAIRDLFVEITKKGTTAPVLSKSYRDTIWEDSFAATTAKDRWHAFNYVLPFPDRDPAAKYSSRVEVRDLVLNKLAAKPAAIELRTPEELRTSTISETSLGISDINLLTEYSADRITASAKDLTTAFSADVLGFLTVEGIDAPLSGTIQIKQSKNKFIPYDTSFSASLWVPADVQLLEGTALTPLSADSQLRFVKVVAKGKTTLIFRIPGSQLEQGEYRVTTEFASGNRTAHYSQTISVEWYSMPLSLADPRDAIEPLRLITTADEYRAITRGSDETLMQRILSYWKNEDPSPGTAYNERMAEFYRRSDYAAFNFAAGRTLDGVQTDRGKIYILFGPPTKIERQLLPGENPKETWIYQNNVRKNFTFIEKSGSFSLAEIKPI